MKGIKMKCPQCDAWSLILETRSSPIRYRRRRECANGHLFTTEELVVPDEQIEQERSERLKKIRAEEVKRIQSKKTKPKRY